MGDLAAAFVVGAELRGGHGQDAKHVIVLRIRASLRTGHQRHGLQDRTPLAGSQTSDADHLVCRDFRSRDDLGDLADLLQALKDGLGVACDELVDAGVHVVAVVQEDGHAAECVVTDQRIDQLLESGQPLRAGRGFQGQASGVGRALRESAQAVDGVAANDDVGHAVEHHVFELLGDFALMVGDGVDIQAAARLANGLHLTPAHAGVGVEHRNRGADVLDVRLVSQAFAAAIHRHMDFAAVADLRIEVHDVADADRGLVAGCEAIENSQHVALDHCAALVNTTPGVQRNRRSVADQRVLSRDGGHGLVERFAGRVDGQFLREGEFQHVCLLRFVSAD